MFDIQAENEMKRLEMELNDMKSLASPEIERFKRQRVFAWQSSLINMTENQVTLYLMFM